MKSQIETELKQIINTRLLSIYRSLDIQRFAFETIDSELITKERGSISLTYALQVQCVWRIIGPEGLVVGYHDRFFRNGPNPEQDDEEFDWTIPGTNRCDEKVERFSSYFAGNPLIVTDVIADEVGGLTITLNNNFKIDIFPDHSLSIELWRFFVREMDTPHFVVTGSGVES